MAVSRGLCAVGEPPLHTPPNDFFLRDSGFVFLNFVNDWNRRWSLRAELQEVRPGRVCGGCELKHPLVLGTICFGTAS